jgi:hypothetical protein
MSRNCYESVSCAATFTMLVKRREKRQLYLDIHLSVIHGHDFTLR